MENDDMSAREGEVAGSGESQQTTHDSFRGPQMNSHMDRRYIPNAGLAPTEETTASAYDSSGPTLRDFPAASSLLPTLSQIECNSFPSENNSASALENSDISDLHEKESHDAEQQHVPQSCQICRKSSMENSRAMVRFLPNGVNAASDISLHVFCGKTASILNSQPHLEILLKAGLKNKHGIGPDVNFALARTRSAVAQGGEADKDPKRLDK